MAENVPYIFRHFHHPWRSNDLAELPWMDLQRLAELSQNKSAHPLAGEAIDYHEGSTLKPTSKHKTSRMKQAKENGQPSFEGCPFSELT